MKVVDVHPMVQIGNVQSWKVFAVRDNGERVPVRYIFQRISTRGETPHLSETHDLTVATHVETHDGHVITLEGGARIVVEAVY